MQKQGKSADGTTTGPRAASNNAGPTGSSDMHVSFRISTMVSRNDLELTRAEWSVRVLCLQTGEQTFSCRNWEVEINLSRRQDLWIS